MARPSAPESRGWTILLVPPHPAGKTRALRVHSRHLRAAGAFCVLGALALLSMRAQRVAEVSATEQQLVAAEQAILVLSDSVRTLADAGDSVAGGDAGAVPSPAPIRRVPVTTHLVSRPRPFAGRLGSNALTPPIAPLSSRMFEGVVLPVLGTITSRFSGSRFHPILGIFRAHKGVDLSAPSGTGIVTPAAGRVRFAGRRFGTGNLVEIDHGNGVVTRYLHCRVLRVHTGQQVEAGALIATVGSTGLATGPHLHFEVLVNGTAVDPLKYLVGAHDSAGRAGAVVTSPVPVGANGGSGLPLTSAPVGEPPEIGHR
ncbi:MAG: Peptidase [Gemmatimonadetes bacterium]|nr:Peptidase [Gemmatimonadota bacterium]